MWSLCWCFPGECLTSDGRRISDGESISIACSICSCAWGELHCSQRMCSTPPGCKRRAASLSTSDLCCGELVCDQCKYFPTYIKTTKLRLSEELTFTRLFDRGNINFYYFIDEGHVQVNWQQRLSTFLKRIDNSNEWILFKLLFTLFQLIKPLHLHYFQRTNLHLL